MSQDYSYITMWLAIVALAIVGTGLLTSVIDGSAERTTAIDLPHRGVVEQTGIENLTRMSTATATTFVYMPRGDEDAISFVLHGYYIDNTGYVACAPLYVTRPREPVTYIVPIDFDVYAHCGLDSLPYLDLTVIRNGMPASATATCRDPGEIDQYNDIIGDISRYIGAES